MSGGTSLHHEAAKWLLNLKLVGPDCPALSGGPDASVDALVDVLRDGVILCQLVHMLDPGCLDMTRSFVFAHIMKCPLYFPTPFYLIAGIR